MKLRLSRHSNILDTVAILAKVSEYFCACEKRSEEIIVMAMAIVKRRADAGGVMLIVEIRSSLLLMLLMGIAKAVVVGWQRCRWMVRCILAPNRLELQRPA